LAKHAPIKAPWGRARQGRRGKTPARPASSVARAVLPCGQERFEAIGRHRTGEQVALAHRALRRVEERALGLRLDAFCDDL
jgi:hypothetical protein